MIEPMIGVITLVNLLGNEAGNRVLQYLEDKASAGENPLISIVIGDRVRTSLVLAQGYANSIDIAGNEIESITTISLQEVPFVE